MIRRSLVTWIIAMLALVAGACAAGMSREKERIAKLTSEIAALEAKMKSGSPEFEAEEHAWEADMARPVAWQLLEVLELKAGRHVTLDKLADGSIKAAGHSTYTDTFVIKTRTNLRGITAFRLELLPDADTRADAVLSELRVCAAPADLATPSHAKAAFPNETVLLHDASSDFTADDQVSRAIDNRADTHWKFPWPREQPHAAVFQTFKPLGQAASTLLTFALVQNHREHGTLDHFRISATTTAPPVRELPENIRTILQLEPTERRETQRAEIANYFRPLAASIRDMARQIEAKKSELAKMKRAMR
jgi:hypothetical protein